VTRSYRLLYIDDARNDHELFAQGIAQEDLPISLVSCFTAREALQILSRDRNFDLILIDIFMPELTGDMLLGLLMVRPELRGIPRMLISSCPPPQLPGSLIHLADHPYVLKPKDWPGFVRLATDLMGILEARLGKRASH
jgi:CheY-like chemotaxis protein